jgi:hypothetical protein
MFKKINKKNPLQLVGNGLGGRIRSQVNIKMSKINDPLVDRDLARGLRDILLPIVWFSDDLDKITDPKLVQKIKSHL